MPDAVLLLARFALAGVLAVAGAAKLADRSGSRAAAEAFAVPAAAAGAVAVGLPLAELAIATLLLPPATASLAAGAAFLLLLVFAGAIGLQLARGRRPDCHCFGRLQSSPVGWGTLVRNLVLAGLAGLIAFAPGAQPDPFAWISGLSRSEIIALAASALALVAFVSSVLFAVRLLRQHGRLLLRLDALERRLAAEGIDLGSTASSAGLPLGTRAPEFELADAAGELIRLEDLCSGRPAVLIFTDQACEPCQALMPTIASWQHRHADDASLAVIDVGGDGTNTEEAETHGPGLVLEDRDLSLYKAYGIAGTPGAVLIAADGTIASPARSGAEGVEAVLEEALSLSEEDEGLPLGTPAPELRLSGVDGTEVDLAAFRGDETVVLFWDPACGFCRQMREDLRALESGPRRLFVVSSGDREEIRNEGFTCAVGLDPELIAGNLFAASGTPIAVLVDADGRIGSPPAVGSEEVLRLLREGFLSLAVIQQTPAVSNT